MKYILLSLLLMSCATSRCPEIKMINESNEPWVEEDEEPIEYAKKACPQVKKMECVLRFYKYGNRRYYAQCGDKI